MEMQWNWGGGGGGVLAFTVRKINHMGAKKLDKGITREYLKPQR